jgi:hypothetical protein
MENKADLVYSGHVVEFVAVANEYCKYMEHAGEIKGEELLKIMQRLLPLLYLKASLLPDFNPYFEDGNEKFVTEFDWQRINGMLRKNFGSADDYLEVFDERSNEADGPVISSISENMADIYQDMKNFLLLYQTGTNEVMNDAIWECRLNFENYWGQKLVNALRAIHMFNYSGEMIKEPDESDPGEKEESDHPDWFISKRQKDFREGNE